jgi:hypothetical protein
MNLFVFFKVEEMNSVYSGKKLNNVYSGNKWIMFIQGINK